MTGWIAGTLVATTLLMLLVLLLRGPVARLFGARVAYALWLLPALRLILPPLPRFDLAVPIPQASAPIDVAIIIAELPISDPVTGPDWVLFFLACWLAGAAYFAVRHVIGYRAFVSEALAGANLIGNERGIAIYETDEVEGPVAIGFLERRILLPVDFAERFDGAEQRLALAHEISHHRFRDLWANAAALFALAIHWFNPVAHRAYRAFRADQELACDARVLALAAPEERRAYGNAMLKSARGHRLQSVLPLNHGQLLKRRVKMLGRHGKSVLRTAAGSAALVLVGGAALALTAPISAGNAAPAAAPLAEARTALAQLVAPPAPPVPPVPLAAVAPLAPLPPMAVPAPPAPPLPLIAMLGAAHDPAVKEERHVIVKRIGKDGKTVTVIDGKDIEEIKALAHKCEGQSAHSDVESGDDTGKMRTRVIICNKDGGVDTAALNGRVAEALEKARRELGDNEKLTEEQRQKAVAAIDREIARLRAK